MGDKKEKCVTNREFMTDANFVKACETANVTPSKRQASRFRSKQGLAYKMNQHMSVVERLVK